MRIRDPFAIEHEIEQEKAATLGRVGDRLEAALEALGAAERELSQRPGDGVLRDLRDQQLEQAAEWLWYLVVQREAVGMTSHDALFEAYGVPAQVRRRMGPRKRGRS